MADLLDNVGLPGGHRARPHQGAALDPNAGEVQCHFEGKGQIAPFGLGGRDEMADVEARGSADVPQRYGHAMLNTGDEDVERIPTWNVGEFEEITLKHWMATAPKHPLSSNLAGVPAATVERLADQA